MKKMDSAIIVLNILLAAKGNLVKKDNICRVGGLTMAQVDYALRGIKDVVAATDDVMFIAHRGPYGGVGITGDLDATKLSNRESVMAARTVLRRVLTGTVNQMHKYTTDPITIREIDLLKRSLGRVVEDLEKL